MASLDSLPGDQRAVLQLVLGRGRSYDDIAGLLHMDRAAVRERALSALDALGPQTRVAADDRATIGDYLLGQLPADEAAALRERLANSAPDRAWARVLSAELAPIASGPLPELGPGAAADAPEADADADAPEGSGDAPEGSGDDADADVEAPAQDELPGAAHTAPDGAAAPLALTATPVADGDGDGAGAHGRPRSSRRGGFVVIALTVVIIIVVVVVLVAVLHGASKKPANTAATPPASDTSTAAATTATTPASTATAPAATATATTGTTPAAGPTSTAAVPLAQINLTPTQAGSKAVGIAEVIKNGSQRELAIVAQHLTPNTSNNAYELWLYNSQSDARSIGFGPVVRKNGKLAAAGTLPADASHFKQLIVTVETSRKPKVPGQIVMQGAVSGLS